MSSKNAHIYYHSDLCGSRAQSPTCLNYAEKKQGVRSKHLGSAAYLTSRGHVTQTLNYLPYGEPYIDQRHAGVTYSERFRFTGKEKDGETGYGYFGARYMDHELVTMWLSVDPMADKYPGISPYAYCSWNPVKLVDPAGNDWYEYTDKKTKKTEVKWTDCHSQDEMNKKGLNGKYLGVTVEDGNTYYSLFGSIEKLGAPAGNLVRDIDREVIKYARCLRAGNSIEDIGYDDFSDVYDFQRIMIGGMNAGGINVHNGSDLHYAGADIVQVMVNDVEMRGRLESSSPTTTPLTGMGGGYSRVSGYRFNIEREHGSIDKTIVTFSYRTKKQADAFTNKVKAMCNKNIYRTLKQMRRVNGKFQQIKNQ